MLSKILSSMVLFCVLFSNGALAIKPISGSQQKHYSNSNVQNHWLILGAIERIKGQPSPEHQLYLNGKLTKWLWKLPFGYSPQQALDEVKSQFKGELSNLYSCQGRQCGISNDYANKVFKQSILSGRDSDQIYWAGLEDGRTKSVWVLYSIKRSNKGVYLYLERLRLDRSAMPELQKFVQLGQLQSLFELHYLSIQRLDSQPAKLSDAQIIWLKDLLKDYPNKKFALVVHRYGTLENQRLLEQTQKEAQDLLDQLANADGFIKNLYAHGAGAMMPRDEVFDRIELVELVEN